MKSNEDNPITTLISSIVAPFILLFGLYIIVHGHYSPGGGFQGGTMLAASVILLRLVLGSEISQLQFNSTWGTPLGSLGVLIYFGTGLAAVFFWRGVPQLSFFTCGTGSIYEEVFWDIVC